MTALSSLSLCKCCGKAQVLSAKTSLSSFNSRGESGRSSAATSVTQSPGRGTKSPTSQRSSITDLELRIDTERTLDLFTMQPRVSGAAQLPQRHG